MIPVTCNKKWLVFCHSAIVFIDYPIFKGSLNLTDAKLMKIFPEHQFGNRLFFLIVPKFYKEWKSTSDLLFWPLQCTLPIFSINNRPFKGGTSCRKIIWVISSENKRQVKFDKYWINFANKSYTDRWPNSTLFFLKLLYLKHGTSWSVRLKFRFYLNVSCWYNSIL